MAPPKAFFVHVMKTGGTSILLQLRNYYDKRRCHPPVEPTWLQKALTAELLEMSRDELGSIDLFMSHVAAATIDVLGFEGLRLTLLRHPVDRAISHLRQTVDIARRVTDTPIEPEQIYEQEVVREWAYANHQIRAFSLGPDELDDWDSGMIAQLMSPWWCTDPPDLENAPIPMDQLRLGRARATLDTFDLVGVTERLDLFADALSERLGVEVRPDLRANIGSDIEISADLRDRLAEDNQLELELYDYARKLAGAGG